MKQLSLFFILLLTGIGMSENQSTPSGMIFSDDFDHPAAGRWQDMKVWGFGVWQRQDGQFISLDPENPSQTIYAASPKIETTLIQRDYSVRFRYLPVNGPEYRFSVGVRQQGWNQYLFEFTRDGRIRIVKSMLGKLPLTLFETEADQIRFGMWQRVRIDVRGERPLCLRCKVWAGENDEEPDFYQAAALDPHALEPRAIGLSISSFQNGGAHTAIDDLSIHRDILPSLAWQWYDGTISEEARTAFEKGQLRTAELELMHEPEHDIAVLNNLAVIHAETHRFEEALNLMQRALAAAPNDEILMNNLHRIWYASQAGDLLNLPDGKALPVAFVRPHQRVIHEGSEAGFDVLVFRRRFPERNLTIVVSDAADQGIWRRSLDIDSAPVPIASFMATADISTWEDGMYRLSLTTETGTLLNENSFEIVRNGYSHLNEEWNVLTDLLKKMQDARPPSLHPNDGANIMVKLNSVERKLADANLPGSLAFFQTQIESDLKRIRSCLERKSPFHHEKGTFMRGYESAIDGSIQGYAICVPENYDPALPHPLVINLHGYDPAFSSWWDHPFLPGFNPQITAMNRFILVNPFGRGNSLYQGIGEVDVLDVLTEVKRLYRIDENRIYLTGGSMGGGGTWHVGLSHPDLFAAIAPIMGPTDFSFWINYGSSALSEYLSARRSPLSFAENAVNLPIWCHHGALDDIVPVEQSRRMVEKLKSLNYDINYREHTEAMHGGFSPEMEPDIYRWFIDKTRDPLPERVVYRAGDLKHSRAYWLSIERFIDPLQFARVDATIACTDTIRITSENTAQIGLTFPKDLFKFVTIQINAETAFRGEFPADGQLMLHARLSADGGITGWSAENPLKKNAIHKNRMSCGPIQDAVNSKFLLVYGSTGTPEETQTNREQAAQFSRQWEEWQHVPCRVKPDADVSERDIQTHHLILFGAPRCNAITRKIHRRLPIRFTGDAIVAGKHQFSGDQVGLVMIYPNPLNPQRYVVLQAGLTQHGTRGIAHRIGTEFDYLIFDDRTLGLHFPQGNFTIEGTPLLYGFFDQDWQLDPSLQFRGDDAVRRDILPRSMASGDGRTVDGFLSDLKAEFSDPPSERDRTFWGQAFRQRGAAHTRGVGTAPEWMGIYHLQGRYKRFSAMLSADVNPYLKPEQIDPNRGKIQFGIYGDDHELYVSRFMDMRSGPEAIDISVEGIDRLKLVVRSQEWLPYVAVGASWIDARLWR